MSDSDDTDVLLLIPPDFFSLNEVDLDSPNNLGGASSNFYTNSMSRNFNALPRDNELLFSDRNQFAYPLQRNFSNSTDLSSISPCTVKSNYDQNHDGMERDYKCFSPTKMVHSTPKSDDNKRVLQEIDTYLTRSDPWAVAGGRAPTRGCGREMNSISTENHTGSDTSPFLTYRCNVNKPEDKLISLNKLWNNDSDCNNTTIQEERMRREHCEKTIRVFHSKLLEYQQKLSVALTVDKAKDEAISLLENENKSSKRILNDLEEKVFLLEKEKVDSCNQLLEQNNELKERNNHFEKELAKAIDLAANFQQKNAALETKAEDLNKSYQEINNINKIKIKDLESRLLNLQHSKNVENDELIGLKKQISSIQKQKDEAMNTITQFESSNKTFEAEVLNLKQRLKDNCEKLRDEKNKSEQMDKQIQSMRQSIEEHDQKENNLIKQLETQRVSLKSYYQKQLEEVVSKKLKEFQIQLDSVEETLKADAKERECLIAERAIKQIELINSKNEEEIYLLNEKHRKELELYRLQLSNASKRIEDLEEKLNSYKSRRADIAEKLHNVMETQWQKALEILISPSMSATGSGQSLDPQRLDLDRLDGTNCQKDKSPENEDFETPTSNRSKTRERLHAYIEFLLSKNPRDLDKLDEFLGHQTSFSEVSKSDRYRISKNSKPPWK